jgi:hypothetical protein
MQKFQGVWSKMQAPVFFFEATKNVMETEQIIGYNDSASDFQQDERERVFRREGLRTASKTLFVSDPL